MVVRDLASGEVRERGALTRSYEWSPGEFQMVRHYRTDHMSFPELHRHIRKMESAGYDVQPYRVDLHGKLSFPFVCLIVPLVAIPFSAAPGRRSSMAAALALSVGVAVAYFFVHSLIVSVGRAGGLEPVIAAWLTNVLFALVGGYRLLGLPQ